MDDHKLQIILAAKDVTQKAFLTASARVEQFTRNIFSMRTAMIGVAGTAALGAFVRKSMEVADAIGKAADAVGISTDTLQEYRHAATLSGVSSEALDKSILQFSKRFGKAKVDTGAMITYLKKYDQTLLNNIKTAKSTDDALKMVFDRMGAMTNAADKAALADAAFGTAGLKMTVMVKDGAIALGKMRQEARDLGIVMDEQLIRASEKANDELEKLTRVLKVQFMSAAVGLAPEIAKIAKSTTDWWKINRKVVIQDVKGWISSITEVVKIGYAPLKQWAELWKVIGWHAGGGKGLMPGYRPEEPEIPKPDVSKPGPGPGSTPKSSRSGSSGGTELEQYYGWWSAYGDAMEDFYTTTSKVNQGALGQIRELDSELQEYYGWWSAYGDTMEDFYTTTSEVIQEKSKESFNVLENLSQRTAEAMEQNFSDFYFDVMSNKFDSLRDYANAALDSIRRATADVLGQMTKELLFGGGASGGSGWISSAAGWLFGGGKQHGGDVDPNKYYLVGERGPELLYTGNRGGQVIPNGKFGGDTNITIPISIGAGSERLASTIQMRVEQTVRNVLREEMR